MDAISRIAELLENESIHKRMAAAIVLGELKPKDSAAVAALSKAANDPSEALAAAAVSALGEIRSMRALPVMLQGLTRGGDVQRESARALSALGADALPAVKDYLKTAAPEVRAAIAGAVDPTAGKQSVEIALEGLRGQNWDAANRVALSMRQEVKDLSPQDRRGVARQVEKFIEMKRVQEDEVALRGALKILGFLQLPESTDTLLSFLGARRPTTVRLEAATALRFALADGPTKKALRKLMELLEENDPLVMRAARDTLTVLPLSPELAEELADCTKSPKGEVALWAIHRLGAMGGKVAEKTLGPVASGKDRARAQAAAQAIAGLPGGEKMLAHALAGAKEEVGAQVLAEALQPLTRRLTKKEISELLKAGVKDLKNAVALARRKLDPVRELDPEAWAEAIRDGAAALKKDPARAEVLLTMLARSPLASLEDKYAFARLLLIRSSKDLHPKARQRDPALLELGKLASEGFPLAAALKKEKALSDDDRYYLGFHFAESMAPEANGLGYELLEDISKKGRGKLAKAAKNKLKLLDS